MHKRLTLSLLALALCSMTAVADPREDLLRQFPEAAGYVYELRDDEAELVAMLTNPGVRAGMPIDPKAASVPLRFTLIEDKKSGATTMYRSDLDAPGDNARLVSRDVTNDVVIDELAFEDHTPPDPPLYPSYEACVADFNCKNKSMMECEANSMCKTRVALLTCHFTDGTSLSVHLGYPPTYWRCALRDLAPPILDGLSLTP